MKVKRVFRFTPAANSGNARPADKPASSEPKEMAEPKTPKIDVGTDEQALAWAEEHDPETADLLRAEVTD